MSSKIELIKQLRTKFGCSLNQAVKSLNESGNDIVQAEKTLQTILSSDNAAKISKAMGKGEGSEGLIGSVVLHNGFPITRGIPAMNRARGGLAQLSCQSDFVGRTDEFKKLVEDVTHSLSFLVDANGFKDVDIAGGVLEAPLIASSPDSTPATTSHQSIQDAITSTIAKVGENITLKRFTAFNLPGAKSEQSPLRALGQFTHSTQSNSQMNSNSPVQLGLLAALVDLEVSGSANQDAVNQLSRKIARQSVAMDCDTVEQLEEQELLGGVDAQTVKAYLNEWTAQNHLESVQVKDFRRWGL